MKIHPKGLPFLPPSTDFLTQESLLDADFVVDTGVDLELGVVHHRNGRVYLSAQSLRTIANAAGFDLVPKSDAASADAAESEAGTNAE